MELPIRSSYLTGSLLSLLTETATGLSTEWETLNYVKGLPHVDYADHLVGEISNSQFKKYLRSWEVLKNLVILKELPLDSHIRRLYIDTETIIKLWETNND